MWHDTGAGPDGRSIQGVRPLGAEPRGLKTTTKLPRNPLIYHEKLLDFVMVCSGLQDLATLAQVTKSSDLEAVFPAYTVPFRDQEVAGSNPVAPTSSRSSYSKTIYETAVSTAMIVSWTKGAFSICPFPNCLTHNDSTGSCCTRTPGMPPGLEHARDDRRRRLSGIPVAGFLRLAWQMVLLACGFSSQAF
jgi:hypothetical protein